MGRVHEEPKGQSRQGADLLFIEASRLSPRASNAATSDQNTKGASASVGAPSVFIHAFPYRWASDGIGTAARRASGWLKLRYDLLPFESVPSYGQEGRLVVSRIALKYLLVTAFVSGIVAVIWSGHISHHIKYVDYVPPPITAPAR
jgi:hypothetical protein